MLILCNTMMEKKVYVSTTNLQECAWKIRLRVMVMTMNTLSGDNLSWRKGGDTSMSEAKHVHEHDQRNIREKSGPCYHMYLDQSYLDKVECCKSGFPLHDLGNPDPYSKGHHRSGSWPVGRRHN